jgi:hypothetical protein
MRRAPASLFPALFLAVLLHPAGWASAVSASAPAPAKLAQHPPGHQDPPGHQHPPEHSPPAEPPSGERPTAHEHPPEHPQEPARPPAHQHHDPADTGAHAGHLEHGLFGPYPLSRDASGTAWQPDLAPHEGLHGIRGPWSWMAHAHAAVVFTDQGGPRGESELYSVNMLMGSARRALGAGTLGLRGMLSLEPATVGAEGYPLLLQTGETADGVTPLVDRQHPHDLFMELAASYSHPVSATSSVFLYLGLPGEPALGPPAFPHRFSAFENPEAPLSHHWLDSTHILFGVVTAGWIAGPVKLEASAFRGREPDHRRWDLESPRLDSGSLRVTWNPDPRWSAQLSHGWIESPEQLAPEVDVDRTTASVIHHRRWGSGEGQAMLAWGRNANRPGNTLDAFILEGTVRLLERHTAFGRVERLENDELLAGHHDGDDHHGEVFRVGALAGGYLYDLWRREPWVVGLGGLARVSFVPRDLAEAYGGRRPFSWGVFLRLKAA